MKRKLTPILLANFLLWSTLGFFTPMTIFLSNVLEFSSTLPVILIQTGIVTLITVLIFTGLTFIIPAKRHSNIISLILILSLLFWLQSNLIGISYGALDGQEINWSNYRVYGIFNTLFWLISLILTIKYSSRVSKHVSSIVTLITVIQSIYLGMSMFTLPPENNTKDYKLDIDSETKFTFSTEKNVIFLVLDTFQTNYFDYVIKQDPKYTEDLTGFTYFPNATGGFNSTYPSIPLILTGKYYDNSQPIQTFIKDSFTTNSLPQFLKSNNFHNEFFTFVSKTLALNPAIIDNLKVQDTKSSLTNYQDVTSLKSLTLFRSLPQFLKQAPSTFTPAEMINSDTMNSSINFIDAMQKTTKTVPQQPQFKFYHLFGVHPPLTVNENLSPENMTWTPPDYERAVKGNIEMIKKFVRILKEAEVYDQSMIVIVGDHGAGMPIDAAAKYHVAIKEDNMRSRALPLMLIKDFQATGAIKIIHKPVTLGDIYKSAANSIQTDHELIMPGLDIFHESIPGDRIRDYFHFEIPLDLWSTSEEYFPPLRRYTITGHSWDKQSWQDTREDYTKDGLVLMGKEDYQFAIPYYKLNTNIDFTTNHPEAEKYQISGWSQEEDDGTWTYDKEAILKFTGLPTNQNLVLDVNLKPFQKQMVEIFCNGYSLGTVSVTQSAHHKLIIPKSVINGSEDRITFTISNPASPLELGISDDARQLGIKIRNLTISEAPL